MDFSQEMEGWSREKLVEARHQLRVLVASPGWQLYCLLVGKQIAARTDSIILQPLEALDDSLPQEYAKGEVAAMRLTIAFAETMIETFTSSLEELKESGNADQE